MKEDISIFKGNISNHPKAAILWTNFTETLFYHLFIYS